MPESDTAKSPTWWITGAILVPLSLATFAKVTHTTFTNAEQLAEMHGENKERRYRLDAIEKKLDHIIGRLEVLD